MRPNAKQFGLQEMNKNKKQKEKEKLNVKKENSYALRKKITND